MKEQVLEQIMKKRSGIDFAAHPELRETPLLGKKIHMPVRELVYVFFDLERELGAAILREAVEEGRFDTFSHILEAIESAA